MLLLSLVVYCNRPILSSSVFGPLALFTLFKSISYISKNPLQAVFDANSLFGTTKALGGTTLIKLFKVEDLASIFYMDP